MKESTEKTEPKVKPKDSKLKEFVKENSKIVLGVIIGVLIMTAGIAVAAGITTSNKSKKPSSQQETSNNYDKKSSDNVKQQNTDASQAPSSGGTSKPTPASTGSSTNANSATQPTTVPPASTSEPYNTPKQPYCTADIRAGVDQSHQSNITIEDLQHQSRLTSISNDWSARGMMYSGGYQQAVADENTYYAQRLQQAEYQYSQDLIKYQCT